MPIFSDDNLYKVLSELAVIDQKKLDEAISYSRQSKTPFSRVLLEKDLISDKNLGKVIAEMLKVPFVELSNTEIPEEVLKIIPQNVAVANKVIAFKNDTKGLHLGLVNPEDEEIVEFISKKTGLPTVTYLITARDFDYAMRFYQQDIQASFNALLQAQVDKSGKTIAELPISKVVDLLVQDAYINKASDIHIEPEDKITVIRFRIDGVLHQVLTVPKNLHEQIVSRIKVLSKLRIDEHLSAQDGKLQVKMPEEDLDIRVSIVPITNGETVVLRLLSSYSRQFGLSDLGMSERDLKIVKDGFSKPYGMVLSTGPTGSGKTTTIYAILKIVNSKEKNIDTIEDPVEYEIEGINQIQVNPKTNLTFAEGLKSILRQDPDIMFVGEIRDDETAGIAINSAMTGHLVLSTLHTNDAATTLPRLIDMGIEPFLVATTVNTIIGQRLVRKICEKCRFSKIVNKDLLVKTIGAEKAQKYFDDKKEATLYQGKGCEVCHLTGYNGRIGIFEVLNITDVVRDLITGKADSEVIMKKAIEEGMTTMLDDGIEKSIKGITNIEEVMRATKE